MAPEQCLYNLVNTPNSGVSYDPVTDQFKYILGILKCQTMGHSTRVFTLILETSNKLYDRYVLTTPEDILNVLEKILNESKSTKTR